MARKKKGQLPSGSIRIQKKVGTGPDGKRIMKSFTGATKEEAEYKYRQYMLTPREEPKKKSSLAVSEAVKRYIRAKAGVLSPSTIKSYYSIHRNHIEGSQLGETDITDINVAIIQFWVSDLSEGHTPKTVRNANALVQASVEMFNPDFRYMVTLPQKIPTNLYCPSDEDVRRLLNEIRDKDTEMYRAVLLAAFGPMRRSEICALTSADVQGNRVTVNKAMVYDEVGNRVVKTTKTVSSNRVIEYPDFVIEALSGVDGAIVTSAPDVLSNRFKRLVKRLGGPQFRFHDLRHYAASIMHAIGVPDQYIMSRGGWSSDIVMKRVYRNVIDLEAAKQTRKITEHFQRVSHV